MVWGSCPGCYSGYCRASAKPVGSWLQVLGGRLRLLSVASPGMQILSYKPLPHRAVGHGFFVDSLLGQRSCGSKKQMWLWFPALHGVLLVTVTAWNSNYLFPDLQPSRQAASFLLTALWFCYVAGLCILNLFPESNYFFLISSILYVVVLKEP